MTDSRCAPRGGMVRGRGGSDDSETVVGSSLSDAWYRFGGRGHPPAGVETESRRRFVPQSRPLPALNFWCHRERAVSRSKSSNDDGKQSRWVSALVTGDSHSKKISRIPRVGGTARADASFRGRVLPNGDGKRLMRISAEGLETGSHATSDRGRSHLENLLHSSVPTPLNALRHMTNR